MKKLFNVLAVITCTMFFAACEYYDHAITGHEDRLSQLENSYLKSVEEQIEGINNSLYHLEAIDTALYALRDSLAQEIENDTPLLPDDNIPEDEGNEGEGNEDENENQGGEGNDEGNENENPEDEGQEAIRRNAEKRDSTLSVLMTAIDAEIADFDNKIAELKNYVDSCMPSVVSSPQDWIEITLATMERSLKVQTEVAELKSLIEIHKADITASYMAALDEAIANCETSMTGWVNEGLAQKYNEIAALDGELNVLATKADSTNIALTEQIATQQVALEQAKEDLTVAYESAITEAIEVNNGRITEEIAAAVLEAQDALQVQIDAILVVIDYIKAEILTIKEDIGNIQDSIATIEDQIKGINSSLKDLTKVDSTLQVLIVALEAEAESLQEQLEAADSTLRADIQKELTNINALIDTLQANDAELDQKIDDLKAYVDGEISNTKDWANATFATLEQYAAMQTEIADIKTLIENYKEEFTTAYTEAIEEAMTAIEEAFAESEESMMLWVNETLQAGYYDIAAIDALLADLETRLNNADATLAEQIAAQQAALEQAKAELTEAYEKAIKEAIEENNGKISDEIAKAVRDAQDALQGQIDAINGEIEAIKAEIALIKESIATINTQIENINASLQQLEEVDAVLLALIESLEAEAKSLQDQLDANSAADAATKQALEEEIANINALIAALQAKDEELDQKIDDLKAYVDGEISATENWANATFATLEQYATMQAEIATLAALIDTYKQELTDDYTAAIEAAVTDMQTAIANLETSMKAWVNETLAQGYYNIATIDGKLAALETKLANADDALAEQIAAQQAALEQAKTDLTAAYETAIKKAIEENNGKITKEINDAVKKATDELNTEINEIWNEIADINKSIETINNQIENINTSLGQLKDKNEALQELIDALEAKAEDLQKQFEAADAATKQELERQIATIEKLIASLQEEDENLQSQINALQKQIDDLKKGSVSKDDIAAIERAIDALEAQMDNLEKTLGDIDAINRRLDELEQKAGNYATDKELSDAIDAIYDKLDELYDAINNGGNTGEDWSDDIADIYETLNDIMDRLDALENLGGGNASGNIQSIRFIPEYNDGKVDLSSGLATLTFILTPNEAASAIAQAFGTNKNVVTAYITRTKSRTRAVDTPRKMTVTTVSGNANGMLEVSVNASTLPAEYWDGSTSCNIYIHINDGNNDIVSEMIPTYQSTPNTATVEAVDLGLSVKWASCNVGAYSSESYGSYYTWSETNNIDFSDNWRMPTASEMRELRDDCDWKWTNEKGISGYRVTGKNGNSIFLPASGFKLNDRTFDEGSYGYYWSSGSGSQANYLEFNSYDYDVNGSEPTYGCTVRPVRP